MLKLSQDTNSQDNDDDNDWQTIFAEYETTCILGPSNVGKTSLFLNLQPDASVKKVILTVLNKEFIVPLNQSNESLDDIIFINVRSKDAASAIQIPDKCVLLVDEIHMFLQADLEKLAQSVAQLKPLQIYFTALTGSYNQYAFDNNILVIAKSNVVISLQGTCHKCGMQTSRSGLLRVHTTDKEQFNRGDIIVGKNSFAPQCYVCSKHSKQSGAC